MKITKLGHCCLLIETKGKRILTDPGTFSTSQDSLTGIDFVIITHEHADHFHIDSVKKVLKNNPKAKIITNSAVADLLKKESIAFAIVAHKDTYDLDGVSCMGWGTKHAPIYKTVKPVENTGYIIDDRLFYPGDAFTLLEREIDILALPVAGPWMKISEAIEYVLAMKPKKCFPVHDGILKRPTMMHGMFGSLFSASGIEFVSMDEGSTHDF